MRGGVGQAGQLILRTLLLIGQRAGLLAGGFYGARQLGAAGMQAAVRKSGLLRLALKAAQLLARFVQAALGLQHPVTQLGMTLLAVRQLHIEFFKARLCGNFALFDIAQLCFDFRKICRNLRITSAGLLGQLRQTQGFNLQFMGSAL